MYRLYNIQALRGFAAILVLISHLLIIEGKYGGLGSVLPEILRYGVFGVDIFFVVSGFIMVTITKGKFRSLGYTAKFIAQRVVRIYPVYWFYSLLVLVVFLVYPDWINGSQGSQVDIVASFLLFPAENLPLLAVGWTLIHEVYFYIIFSLILMFFNEDKLPYALSLWTLAIIVLNLITSPSSSPLIRLVVHPLTLEFIAGCFLALLYFKNKGNLNIKTLAVFTITMVAISLYLFVSEFGANGVTPVGWVRPLIFGIPAVCVVYFFLMAEKVGWVFNKIFVTLGDASFSIYLSHILTLSLAGRLWSIVSSDGIIDNVIAVPVMFLFSCVSGVIAYFWIEVPIIKMTKKITN